MILLALAAATLTLPSPLPDKDGDGRVTISKAIVPFKRGDTLTLCPTLPAYSYRTVCPALAASAAPAVDRMAIRGALTAFSGSRYFNNAYPDAPINGKVIERMSLVCGNTCIKFGRASTSGTVRDVEIRASKPAVKHSEIDTGIAIGGSKGGVPTTGILIERVWSHGWQMEPTVKGYKNGDGFVANRDVGTVTIRDSRFDDNADAGVDSKAADLILDNVSASDNGHYGFRFWGGARATTLTCRNNAWGCIQIENGAKVVIDRLIAVGGDTGDQELVTTHNAGEIEIRSCDLSGWKGALLKQQGKPLAKVTLGEGCTI